jgi:hypothetical protein
VKAPTAQLGAVGLPEPATARRGVGIDRAVEMRGRVRPGPRRLGDVIPVRQIWWPALVAALLSTTIACSDESPATEAVDDPGPVTLRIGTADDSDRPGAEAVTKFARQVRALSGGQLLVNPVWEALTVSLPSPRKPGRQCRRLIGN